MTERPFSALPSPGSALIQSPPVQIDRWERRELPVTFVIVDRDRPNLVEELKNRFAGDPSVRIIFDRRIRLGDSPVADERRWDAEGLSAVLSNKGYIIIRTE